MTLAVLPFFPVLLAVIHVLPVVIGADTWTSILRHQDYDSWLIPLVIGEVVACAVVVAAFRFSQKVGLI
jgi:hypothetical protein